VAQLVAAAQRKAGWSDADTGGKGWNVGERTVETTSIRRIPVQGLKRGNQADFVGAEKDKTIESAAGKAIVLVPAGLDPAKATDVLLHLHGYTHRSWDPYAGWRQRAKDDTVRDVALDRIAQQMQAAGDPQLLAILAQGVGPSDFGKGFAADPYIGEVLDKLVSDGSLKPRPAAGKVVLSGHSGAGHTIRQMLAGGAGGPGPGALAEVVLFEAINVNWAKGRRGELDAAINWVAGHLNRLLPILSGKGSVPDKEAALAATPKLRGYYSVGGSYAPAYKELDGTIKTWFGQHAAKLGTWAPKVQDLFRVIPISGTRHETVVRGLGDDPSAGPLAEALRARHGSGGGQAGATPTPAPAPAPATATAAITDPRQLEAAATRLAAAGLRDDVELTDRLFNMTNPELGGGRIPAERDDLKRAWVALRRRYAKPAVKRAGEASPTPPPTAAPPVQAPPKAAGAAPPTKGKAASAKQAEAHPELAAEWGQLNGQVQAAFHKGFAQYVAVKPLYDKRLKGQSPVAWLNTLEFGTPWCGFKLRGVDPRLSRKLAAIQDRAIPLIDAILAAKVPVKFEGTFQPRAVTGKPENLSDHALGLALHLNYERNPYIGRNDFVADLIERISASSGQPGFWKTVKAKGRASSEADIERVYAAYAHTSDAVGRYFQELAEMEAADKEGRLDAAGQAEMRKRQKDRDRYNAAHSKGGGNFRDPTKGFYAHTAGVAGDPMLALVKLLTLSDGAGLEWGGTYGGRAKDLHHFALKGVG
jgi:hypothetical protein